MKARILGRDFLDGLDRFDRITPGFFLPCRDREGQGVDDDVLNPQTPLVDQRVNQATSDADFVHCGSRLALFIDGERDNGGSVFLDQWHDGGEA